MTARDPEPGRSGDLVTGGLHDEVWAALGTVLDPELDEPITELDFVESCTVSEDGDGSVVSRSGSACPRSSARPTSPS